MARLIGFEFGKLVKRKIVAAALILLGIYGVMLYMGNGPQSEMVRLPDGTYLVGREAAAYDRQVAEAFAGPLTQERAAAVLEQYRPDAADGGFWIVNNIYDSVQQFFGNIDGTYNGATVAEAFPAYRDEKPLMLGYNAGYISTLYIGTYLMAGAGILFVIVLSPVFSEEYARGTDALLLSSRNGKRKCGWAKIAASYLFVLLVTVLMLGILAAGSLLFYGTAGAESSVQVNGSFMLNDVPYFLTCMQAVKDAFVLWSAGALLLAAWTLFLSALCRSPFVAVLLALGGYFGVMFGRSLGVPAEILSLTPFWCFMTEPVLEIPGIFQGRLSYVWVPAALALLLVPAVFFAGRRLFARHQVG